MNVCMSKETFLPLVEWMNENIYIARLKAYKCMLNLLRSAENYSKVGVLQVEKNGL